VVHLRFLPGKPTGNQLFLPLDEMGFGWQNVAIVIP
jgi:hypothetical protein